MDKLRVVRALVSFNKTTFFFDNERPRGMTYDALVEFEKSLNCKLHPNDRNGKEKIHVVLVPTTPSKVASDLQKAASGAFSSKFSGSFRYWGIVCKPTSQRCWQAW
jgi:hypothetical protein